MFFWVGVLFLGTYCGGCVLNLGTWGGRIGFPAKARGGGWIKPRTHPDVCGVVAIKSIRFIGPIVSQRLEAAHPTVRRLEAGRGVGLAEEGFGCGGALAANVEAGGGSGGVDADALEVVVFYGGVGVIVGGYAINAEGEVGGELDFGAGFGIEPVAVVIANGREQELFVVEGYHTVFLGGAEAHVDEIGDVFAGVEPVAGLRPYTACSVAEVESDG